MSKKKTVFTSFYGDSPIFNSYFQIIKETILMNRKKTQKIVQFKIDDCVVMVSLITLEIAQSGRDPSN